jgi:alpha-L-rhamnosidase
MNSFNHYAYGAVLAWVFRHAAGIAPDRSTPGFRKLHLAPRPDRRLGWIKAEYRSAAGLVKSAWRYEGDEWVWDFTVPEGATASVTLPGRRKSEDYLPGSYTTRLSMPAD